MKELFSELYSTYFRVTAEILRKASASPIKRAEMSELADRLAFSESGLTILPKLIDGEWDLLKQGEGGWLSKVRVPELPLTALQRSWLKALLPEPRFSLFLDEAAVAELSAFLAEDEPLFHWRDFQFVDCCADGDPYSDPGYRQRFRVILKALKEKTALEIQYGQANGREKSSSFFPCKLEYSQKDDKFRLYAARINSKPGEVSVLNLGRILSVESGQPWKGTVDLDGFFRRMRCEEPVLLRIFPQRNALERCMLEFASFEKQTEHDEKTDSYLCTIYYDRNDETELLIRVLSFGPAVRVLGPPRFLSQVRERVRRQHELLRG